MCTLKDFIKTEIRVFGDVSIRDNDDRLERQDYHFEEYECLSCYDVPDEFLEMEVEYIFYDKKTEMLVIEVSKQ